MANDILDILDCPTVLTMIDAACADRQDRVAFIGGEMVVVLPGVDSGYEVYVAPKFRCIKVVE